MYQTSHKDNYTRHAPSRSVLNNPRPTRGASCKKKTSLETSARCNSNTSDHAYRRRLPYVSQGQLEKIRMYMEQKQLSVLEATTQTSRRSACCRKSTDMLGTTKLSMRNHASRHHPHCAPHKHRGSLDIKCDINDVGYGCEYGV